jgi:hypothetical protein
MYALQELKSLCVTHLPRQSIGDASNHKCCTARAQHVPRTGIQGIPGCYPEALETIAHENKE